MQNQSYTPQIALMVKTSTQRRLLSRLLAEIASLFAEPKNRPNGTKPAQ
jgi:hypothetical protein